MPMSSSHSPRPAALFAAAVWVVSCSLASGAAARPGGAGARERVADPTDARAAVPRLAHESSLSRYRRYAEQPVGSWREVNETVNRIGGWRAYAREANEAAATAASAVPAGKATPPPPNARGHQHHPQSTKP
jgi:hypothetical protein